MANNPLIELELLAPAKDTETGLAAISHGADAIYIAAHKFGAREKAGNSLEAIARLIREAHQYSVKVYITVNTIIYNHELNEVETLINNLYNIGADAVIIQDFAIPNLNIPPIALHASTQMHNISSEKIRFLEHCGISRVVLPRELTLEEIKQIRQTTDIDLEFFVHGALCVSYSGQCYISQLITNRSANRGACAQLCRQAYDLITADGTIIQKNKHLLSLKDLNLSDSLPQLIQAGITSFKIEGRLKDAAYVKNVTAHYNNLLNDFIERNPKFRRASSGKVTLNFTPDPAKSFNRGFTQHFIGAANSPKAAILSPKSIGKKIGTVRSVSDTCIVIDSRETIAAGDGLCFFTDSGITGFRVNRVANTQIYPNTFPNGIKPGTTIFRNNDNQFEKLINRSKTTRKIGTSIEVTQSDQTITLTAVDVNNTKVSLTIPDTFENARNPQDALIRLAEQLKKSGNSIFHITEVTITKPSTPKFIPIATINRYRRELLEQLKTERLKHYRRPKRRSMNTSAFTYPSSELDYRGNISNRISRNFLQQHGVKKISPAFEIQLPLQKRYPVMTSRYCIKFELGLCPSKQHATPTKPLFLCDKRYCYPLEFDCKTCQMTVMNPIPRNKVK